MISNPRVLAISDKPTLASLLRDIGVDKDGIEIMSPKGTHRLLQLERVDFRAANILKQEMLGMGGEAAISGKSYRLAAGTTDVVLMGNRPQFDGLCAKLSRQPFKLPQVGKEIKEVLANFEASPPTLKIGRSRLNLAKRTHIMGVLNVTPDSFSDGGKFFDAKAAVLHALQMAKEGADIIDVGGESSRPGAHPVSVREEIDRTVPVIEGITSQTNKPISIDTYKWRVAEAALEAGAAMVNDITGLRDRRMIKLVVERKVPVVIMHMKGSPQTMQENPQYESLMGEIVGFLRAQSQAACSAGVAKDKIIVDPGIGFGKTVEHNLEIMKRLSEIKSLGYPIMIGASRKSFIGKVLDLEVEERLEGTAATIAYGISQGARIVRVHDAKQMSRVVRMTDAMVRIAIGR